MTTTSVPPPSQGAEFERQVKRVQQDVLRMGALVENSCWLAYRALFERDLEAAQKVKPQDKSIDKLYKQIEVDCVRLMAAQKSTEAQVRLLSSLMQLVRDLERIGDYAKDLSGLAMKLFAYNTSHPMMDRVRLMLERCRAMLAMSLEALVNMDAQAGRAVKAKDDAVDSDYEDLYNQLIQTPDGSVSVEMIVMMALLIRHLERMADHSTNIGNRVVFIVTGERR
ncbi:MAG: phosphate signaling complex protein PhoU [Cyanobacteria bacterium P01_H01_bin.121]